MHCLVVLLEHTSATKRCTLSERERGGCVTVALLVGEIVLNLPTVLDFFSFINFLCLFCYVFLFFACVVCATASKPIFILKVSKNNVEAL